MGFLKPKMPEAPRVPDALPPAPERTDAETAALAEQQRNRVLRRGRASTMLTGGAGTDGGSSVVSFLGGSART